MAYPPDKPKGVTVRTGETRHHGERHMESLKHNPGRDQHPDKRMSSSHETRRGSHGKDRT